MVELPNHVQLSEMGRPQIQNLAVQSSLGYIPEVKAEKLRDEGLVVKRKHFEVEKHFQP